MTRPPGTWLVKSEPDTYPYEQLEHDGRTMWDGVRNYQARNYMRDDMRPGDRCSSTTRAPPSPAWSA